MKLTTSPYINHFIQPDTIIPNPSNPQSWNRFSYVGNNPIRYTDPTGHSPIDGPCGYQGQDCGSPIPASPSPLPTPPNNPPNGGEGGGNGGNGSGGSTAGNGGGGGNCIPAPGQWICDLDALIYEPNYCPNGTTLVNCWEQDLPLYMGKEPMNIDPAEWDELLSAIRNQANGMKRWQLIALALIYDTPFYDNSVYGLGKLPGTGCVGQGCYDRSELNYIAQGELWAAAGLEIEEAIAIVRIWKSMPIMHFPSNASGGTLIMLDIGFQDYVTHYPNVSP
jgi:hypothetical protein